MAYRGENIDIVIKGSDIVNLDNNDFVVLLYPDRHPERKFEVHKSEMVKLNSNHYSGGVEYTESKALPLGSYTIELLIKEGTTRRSVFVKPSAFPLYDSASKNIE